MSQKTPQALTQKLCLYDTLPYGTRFRYQNGDKLWVKLPDYSASDVRTGLIAEWMGFDAGHLAQSLCSLADTEEERKRMSVIVVDVAHADRVSLPRPTAFSPDA
jgi:hypothetical protein